MRKNIIAAVLIPLMLTGCGGAGEAAPETTSVSSETVTVSETTSATTTVTTTVTTAQTTTVTTTEATTTTESETEPFIFEDTPENAYNKLMNEFEKGCIWEEPEDYGGTYSYFGKLYVNITTDEPSDFYKEIFGEYTCVEFKTVDHSIRELVDIRNKAAELLETDEEGRFSVFEEGIDFPSNKASIGISGDPKAANRFLKEIPDRGFELSDIVIYIVEE